MSDTKLDGLVRIRIVGMPIAVTKEAQEHQDGVNREFALIATSAPSDAVPVRLRQLSEQLQGDYGMYTEEQQRQLDEAIERGEDTINLDYDLPPSVGAACQALRAMLEEADEYCRRGDLLSLATPAHLVRFRNWFLDEFVNQVEGKPPTPWSEYAG